MFRVRDLTFPVKDSLTALMLTAAPRLHALPHYGASKLWWKSRCTSEVVDIDDLAWTVDFHLGYLLDARAPPEFGQSPVLLLELLSLLKKSDYAYAGHFRQSGDPAVLPGPGARNLLRPLLADGARRLFSRLLAGTPPPVGPREPHQVLVSSEAFARLLRAVYAEAYRERPVLEKDGRTPKRLKSGQPQTRSDTTPQRSPAPSEEQARAVAARLAWALDKSTNGGRPGYDLADECARDDSTRLPLHGFEMTETENGRFRARPSHRVASLAFYGVRQSLA